MAWGDESDDSNTKFKEVVLPPGVLDEEPGETIATSLMAPDATPAASAPRSARHLSDPSTGRETWNRELRPRHRKVVRDYFGGN
jgi:hypothetical protein